MTRAIREHSKLVSGLLTIGWLAIACQGSFAQMPASWVLPTYPTTAPIEGKVTVADRYSYREQRYDPPVKVDHRVPKELQRDDTPEMAMIGRVSAMMNQDYEWWLSTWDQEAQRLTADNDRAMGRTAAYWLQWWDDMFRSGTVALVRRIETRQYVVLTYRLVAPSGEDVGGGMELPVVFRKVESRWLATLDLREDVLVLSLIHI